MTLDAVIIHIGVWIHGWLSKRAVLSFNARFSDKNFGAEHLLCSIIFTVGIPIAVRRILGEVIDGVDEGRPEERAEGEADVRDGVPHGDLALGDTNIVPDDVVGVGRVQNLHRTLV